MLVAWTLDSGSTMVLLVSLCSFTSFGKASGLHLFIGYTEMRLYMYSCWERDIRKVGIDPTATIRGCYDLAFVSSPKKNLPHLLLLLALLFLWYQPVSHLARSEPRTLR